MEKSLHSVLDGLLLASGILNVLFCRMGSVVKVAKLNGARNIPVEAGF